MSLLQLEQIEASYGAVRALQGIDMQVDKGAIVAVLGANGAGKSTTLKSISGTLKPSGGRVSFDGADLSGMTPNQLVRMGIAHVPEGRKVFADLTVMENLRMGAYSRSDKAEIDKGLDLVRSLFPRLQERESQLGGSLSGGEQQMLAIGRGLMARPKLLMLDEPSLGLAPIIIADIFETLRRINEEQGTTMLIVEQNLRVALKNADYGYVLQVGRIVVQGPAAELRDNEEIAERYLGIKR